MESEGRLPMAEDRVKKRAIKRLKEEEELRQAVKQFKEVMIKCIEELLKTLHIFQVFEWLGKKLATKKHEGKLH